MTEVTKIEAGIGNKGEDTSAEHPATLYITLNKDEKRIFSEFENLLKKQQKKGKILFSSNPFPDTKNLMIDFADVNDIEPFLKKLEGHDLVEDYYNNCSLEKTSIQKLRDDAQKYLDIGKD